MPKLSLRSQNKDEIDLGKLGRFRTYRIPASLRVGHQYIIGISGSGKSKHLENLCYQKIIYPLQGLTLIDPHALLIEDLMRLLITKQAPAHVWEQTIYVDPSRTDFVIPFNVLATPDDPYRVSISIIEAMKRAFPTLKDAPHFSNLMLHSCLVAIKSKQNLTLVDIPKLMSDKNYRDHLLMKAGDPNLTAYFHDRFDTWRDTILRESSLNKVTAFSTNPYLRMMLGTKANHLDFRKIMDGGYTFLLDLGRSDTETNRLIGGLVVTGIELAMRRRQTQIDHDVVIDEFAGYVANDSSEVSLTHVLSEGRKSRVNLTIAHQTTSQISPRVLGAISNCPLKTIFQVGRYDAEYLAKFVGRINVDDIRQTPTTESEQFTPIQILWEQWVDHLRFQQPRHATIALDNNPVVNIKTMTIPPYTSTEEQVEEFRLESVRRWGIPYSQALHEVEQDTSSPSKIPDYDAVLLGKGQAENQRTIEHLRAMEYPEYLLTDHWKRTRRNALKRAKYRCQLCNEKGQLDVHHRTYENRGDEQKQDVITLCHPCHEKFHEANAEKSQQSGVSTPTTT